MIKEILARLKLCILFTIYMSVCLVIIPPTVVVFGADKAIETISYLEAVFSRVA